MKARTTRIVATAVAAALLAWSWAEDATPKKDPIEKDMEEEMEKDPSTQGMSRAIFSAETKWDRVMNEKYQALQKTLDSKNVAQLKEAQKAWLAFRDKEFALIDGVYGKLEGTMYIPMRANARMELTKARARELTAWVEFLKEHQP